MKIFILTTILFGSADLLSQQAPIQYYRPNDKTGLNVFETSKEDTTEFEGLRVKIGGNFTQDFQGLRHDNDAAPIIENNVNMNELTTLTSGFNLAMANLALDAQLADGVRLNLTIYLSSRHHQETWVKGGYIQFDKLPFLKNKRIDHIMQNITIKVGDYEVDYGDQHYRRSDGGNSIYNPFIENYIMDEFTTEIGGEIYYHSHNGVIAMLGVTNGQLNPTVVKSSTIDAATGKLNTSAPAIHAKLGYEGTFNKNSKYRLTGSLYAISSGSDNTLFFGDRTGSHYFFVLENTLATSDGNAWSARFNPQFTDQVTTFMINPFIKLNGLEVFGTFEMAKGRMVSEVNKRNATQFAVDVVYRFPQQKENFWIGGRYNSVSATLPSGLTEVMISRFAASAGWFVTKNLVMKMEYVSQEYHDFPAIDIRSGAKFDGFMVQASVAF